MSKHPYLSTSTFDKAVDFINAKIAASDDPQIVPIMLEAAEEFSLDTEEAYLILENSTYPADEETHEEVKAALVADGNPLTT